MVLREGQDEDSGSTKKRNSAQSTYYIKAMTTYLAKGMSAVDPYYFCVSLTVTLHACVHVH